MSSSDVIARGDERVALSDIAPLSAIYDDVSRPCQPSV